MAKKILVVDDSPTMLMMYRLVLSKHGYDLVLANNGNEAVEKARAEKPDLVFLDVIMPGMTGYETCRALRKLPGHATTPIIMLTTRSESGAFEEAFNAGCTDYMTKPLDARELEQKLRNHLEA